MGSDTTPWLVGYTKPNSENKAARWLRERGAVVYTPLLEDVRIHSQGVDRKTKPLFPRYVFVQDREDLDPVTLVYLPGMSGFVRLGDQLRFARIENDVIETLRETEIDGVLRADEPEQVTLEKGDQVRIPYRYGGMGFHIVGTFLRMDGDARAIVLMKLFGRDQETPVDVQRLELVMEGGSSIDG